MRKYALLAVLPLTIIITVAILTPLEQPRCNVEEVEDLTAAFFTQLEAGDYAGAIDNLYANNPWMSVSSDEILKLRSQFAGLPSIVGAHVSHELMLKETVSDRYVFLWYFVATDRQPLAFKFQFYRPHDTWVTYAFAYSDDIDDWLEEKAKMKFFFADSQ